MIKKSKGIARILVGGALFLAGAVPFFTIIMEEVSGVRVMDQIMVAVALLLLFGIVGYSVIRLSFRKNAVRKRLTEIEGAGIYSDQKSSHLGFYITAGLISVPALLVAIYGMVFSGSLNVMSLLFLIVGYVLFAFGRKSKSAYDAIGATPIQLDPEFVVVGREFGGSFPLQAKPRNGLTLRLTCLHSYTTGSGDNRTNHTDVLHQQDTRAFIDTDTSEQQRVVFLFDIPSDVPGTDSNEHRGTIRWQLKATGQVTTNRKVPGTQIAELMEFSRTWDIPFLSLELANELGIEMQASQLHIPKQHQETVQREKQQEAQQSVSRQIAMEAEADGSISLISEAGRNKGMWGMLLVFGFILGVVGIFLVQGALRQGGGLWFMASAFVLAGWGMFFYGLFVSGRKLETSLRDGHVQVIRSLFGRQLYQRNGKITSPSQLQLKATMTSTAHDHVKTEYMALYAEIDGQSIKLVEGIKGRQAGEAMMANIKAALTTSLDDELV